jgi:D-alanyl-D-alanine carboxypeptidase
VQQETHSSVTHHAARGGWMIQVGAFAGEEEAKQRLTAAQSKAARVLALADAFTERVVKGDKALYRARFAGFEKDEAEAACNYLKRNDIACMPLRN